MEYFSRSPFYDPLSNNETLRMQGTNMTHLQGMTGVEFALDERVVCPQGRLFLIKRQRRSSPSSVHVLNVYYILDGTVYQSPDLLHLLMTKYNKITSGLAEALSLTLECVDYSQHVLARPGGSRRVFPPPPSAAQERIGVARGDKATSRKKRQKISDCRDFPAFSNCLSDMEAFLVVKKQLGT